MGVPVLPASLVTLLWWLRLAMRGTHVYLICCSRFAVCGAGCLQPIGERPPSLLFLFLRPPAVVADVPAAVAVAVATRGAPFCACMAMERMCGYLHLDGDSRHVL